LVWVEVARAMDSQNSVSVVCGAMVSSAWHHRRSYLCPLIDEVVVNRSLGEVPLAEWMEDWFFLTTVDVRVERQNFLDSDWVDLQQRRRQLPNLSHDDGTVQIVPNENRGVAKTMVLAELIDFETMVAVAFARGQMDLRGVRVVATMDDDASQVVADSVAVGSVMIAWSHLRNLLNTLNCHWDYCSTMTTSTIWFGFAVAAVVTVDDCCCRCHLTIPRRSWLHVSVERAAPIAMLSYI
jgi:hypothetical protein